MFPTLGMGRGNWTQTRVKVKVAELESSYATALGSFEARGRKGVTQGDGPSSLPTFLGRPLPSVLRCLAAMNGVNFFSIGHWIF